MRVEWAMACRYCEVTNNQISMIGGNRNLFRVPGLPAAVDFWLAFQVFAPADMSGPDVEHEFRCRVLDPSLDEVYTEPAVDFRMPQPGQGASESEQVVAWRVAFQAGQLGMHMVELRVDDRSKTLPIYVEQTLTDDGD